MAKTQYDDEFDDEHNERKISFSFGKLIILFVIIIIGLFALFSSAYQVDAGERAVLLKWGDPQDVAISEGLHFKVPIRDEVVKVDVKTQKSEADASAASKDLQIINTKVALNYHLIPELTPSLYKEIGLGYNERVIQPSIQEIVKASTAQFTAEIGRAHV